ncbi:AmmeMemoRadiSam system protein B [Mangrovimicrobium sediminis]|uniref:MEMO1 family protein E4634_06320 n=1 Tax=Mangrovimicrobium sediminis TaxID=2562682 RepID=A0A4Z0M5W7_9GAMM|nr:AmmeMemoRadiSam system protein B [Haliea sp. SAOS-164]TGD74810.1 AmmeMemoRadiSam system protein B [Haliea sp. SAOS-164]
MPTRPAAVAGSFYQDNAAVLREYIAHMLKVAASGEHSSPKALIVPHAGHIYSGPLAARAYRLLLPVAERIRRVVVLGPAHRAYVRGIAAPSTTAFRTPLGEVPLDEQGIELALGQPQVTVSDEAHALEHCIEVQLPFLQVALPQFALVPLLVGECAPQRVGAVIDALWGGDETLIVISSDLSHFEDYDSARHHDLESCRKILAGETNLDGKDACGAGPINGLLCSEHGSRLAREWLGYCNSGDTAGDRNRVVGYGAFSLH